MSPRSHIVFTVALLAALALVWYLRSLVLLVYASVLFAILVMPFVEWVERPRQGLSFNARWQPGRGLAIVIALACGLILLGLLLLVLLPPLITESTNLIAVWPQQANRALAGLQRVPGFHHVDFSHLEAHLAQAGSWALVLAQSFAAGVADLFTILLLTVYLVADGQSTRDWCFSFIPPLPRQRLSLTLDRGQHRMRGWLFGQASLALLLGISSAVVFGALRIPYFYVLALIAALLSFVPILGQIVAATITAVVAAADSWGKLAGVLIFFSVYQIVDNGYLTPRVMRDAVDVPGLAVIIALAIGGAVGGFLGAALAVPSAALVAELLKEYAYYA